MYSRIVEHLVARSFAQVNSKDHDALLASCVPEIRHRFGGDHALGGERRDVDALRRWFDRLGRLVPDLDLRIHDVWVKGAPWATTAIVRWTSTASFPDGAPYVNHGVHVVALRWGKVVAIDANEDSQAVARLLDALAAAGVEEASAAPITG